MRAAAFCVNVFCELRFCLGKQQNSPKISATQVCVRCFLPFLFVSIHVSQLKKDPAEISQKYHFIRYAQVLLGHFDFELWMCYEEQATNGFSPVSDCHTTTFRSKWLRERWKYSHRCENTFDATDDPCCRRLLTDRAMCTILQWEFVYEIFSIGSEHFKLFNTLVRFSIHRLVQCVRLYHVIFFTSCSMNYVIQCKS